MTEQTDEDISRSQAARAEDLLALIRREARFLEQEEQVQMSTDTVPLPLRELPVWEQTDDSFPIRQSYHVNEFLVYDDIEFVVNAYRGILQRDADESGLDTYTAMLRSDGEEQKIPILLNLTESAEARQKQVHVRGLRWERWHLRYEDKWWFKGRRVQNLFKFARNLVRDVQQEYTLENEVKRQRQQRKVDGYLSEQHRLFDFMRQREQQLEGEQSAINLKMDRYRRDMLLARQDLLGQQQRLNLLLSELRNELASEQLTTEQRVQLASHASEQLDTFYLAFENECRGDEADIRQQLSVYLPQLQACDALTAEQPLLDIGCGRGEWLALLKDSNVPASGVDISPVLVDHCARQDLAVTLSDALEFLAQQEADSFGAITSFHVIEHIPFQTLFALVEQCHRVLVPGGILIFETPNPENLMVGSHTFYHDPTHLNPITPTMIEFLVRHLGFVDTDIMRLHPYPEDARVQGMDPLTERVNGAFCGPQDFAVCAVKPG